MIYICVATHNNARSIGLLPTMGASGLTTLLRIRVPAAMPAFTSGLKVAAASAPVGAVVGV